MYDSFRTSQRTQCATFIKKNQLKLFRELMTVYFENDKENI
jgi:hypothetical protein